MLIRLLFRNANRLFRDEYEILRCPRRTPKCYDMTDEERRQAIVKINRNVWNEHDLAMQDNLVATKK